MLRLPCVALLAGAVAIVAIPVGAQTSTSNEKAFCLQKGTSGARECAYDTMEQCRKSMTGAADNCFRRTETRGQGGLVNPPPSDKSKR